MTKVESQSSPVLEATTSVVKAFKEVSHKQLSGQLTISYLNSFSGGWRVYFGQGKVHYATSLIAQKERIKYLLSRHFPRIKRTDEDSYQEEYRYLCSFWQSGQLSIQELRGLIYRLSQEALTHCLASPPANLKFEETLGLDPILVSAPVKEIAYPIRPDILEWMKLREGIASPLLRVGIESLNQFYDAIAQHSALSDLKALAHPLTRFPNLYELARMCRVDVLNLAYQLQPYAVEKKLQLKPYTQSSIPKGEAPVVACIDDSHAVQRNVKLTLEAAGYEVLSLTEPARALTTLVRKKPVLILMDITMPEMNGYDLSRILRKSGYLTEVPIVMLTGRDGVVDRLRARMVGANDYMTKPFNPHQLIEVVQQFTRKPQSVAK